ncbi:GDP-mannose 4,6-dehydratase [Aquihabitans sp. G128]|uniref:GDP-mannose 4,6-dehydratase n=1 Tax=Aquihabitans sp. G128 TaxID=2849779 RepID=UPI001C25012A|nr:GDP-mannose 4,6-dehydratase [Aquihabitans sp. G128]QXC62830.1 GDP-mannose 4,6-dehydratase [Aquihabitans sp. G128]
MSPTKALVTGAHGFVGHHLIDHLTASGDEVIGIDRATDGLDITDAEAVHEAIREIAPTCIYHLAGWADVGASWRSPVAAFRVNAEGTLNVLGAARDAGVERVLAVSSADVYGIVTPEELPLTEDSPLRPASPYAASKVAADYLGLQAWLGRGLPVLRVRAFNHLGPGQTDQFVAPALAHRVAQAERDGGEVLTVGDLSARRDFTDVRDVVRAYRLLMEHGEPGEVYNVCSGVDLAVQDLADQLVAQATVPLRLEVDPALLRPVELPVLRGSHERLSAATGWQPEISIEQTLTDLLADWRRRVAEA